MSLPCFDGQKSLFGAGNLAEPMFEADDPYRLFREKMLPLLRRDRPKLEQMYCLDNGRPGIEPVTVAAVSLLQYMHKLPDREALEAVKYHLGWKYAMDLELIDKGFHPTTLVVFRDRLLANESARLLFDEVLEELRREGLVSKRGKQRLDSAQVVGDIARMSRLEMVRETLRVALIELKKAEIQRPAEWETWWERYCETKVDWRCSKAVLIEKMGQAGEDAAKILEWLQTKSNEVAQSKAVETLRRVFDEQFELREEKTIVSKAYEPSGCVKNPHDPDAQWSAKDKERKTAWVGYKVQVMETVKEEQKPCEKGEPTGQFITEIVTTEAITSDIEGMKRVMKAHEKGDGERPTELFVDTAYVSDDTLAEAAEQGMELMGPARFAPEQEGVLPSDEFEVSIERREAVCPAGKKSTQCSHIRDAYKGTEYYRFEWGAQCDDCERRKECTKSRTGRRMLVVGKHHELLQQRRREMETEEFKTRKRQRNAIEGTISELSRGYGLKRTRYRGLGKTKLANYLIGAACNIARWFRLIVWRRRAGMAAQLAPG